MEKSRSRSGSKIGSVIYNQDERHPGTVKKKQHPKSTFQNPVTPQNKAVKNRSASTDDLNNNSFSSRSKTAQDKDNASNITNADMEYCSFSTEPDRSSLYSHSVRTFKTTSTGSKASDAEPSIISSKFSNSNEEYDEIFTVTEQEFPTPRFYEIYVSGNWKKKKAAEETKSAPKVKAYTEPRDILCPVFKLGELPMQLGRTVGIIPLLETAFDSEKEMELIRLDEFMRGHPPEKKLKTVSPLPLGNENEANDMKLSKSEGDSIKNHPIQDELGKKVSVKILYQEQNNGSIKSSDKIYNYASSETDEEMNPYGEGDENIFENCPTDMPCSTDEYFEDNYCGNTEGFQQDHDDGNEEQGNNDDGISIQQIQHSRYVNGQSIDNGQCLKSSGSLESVHLSMFSALEKSFQVSSEQERENAEGVAHKATLSTTFGEIFNVMHLKMSVSSVFRRIKDIVSTTRWSNKYPSTTTKIYDSSAYEVVAEECQVFDDDENEKDDDYTLSANVTTTVVDRPNSSFVDTNRKVVSFCESYRSGSMSHTEKEGEFEIIRPIKLMSDRSIVSSEFVDVIMAKTKQRKRRKGREKNIIEPIKVIKSPIIPKSDFSNKSSKTEKEVEQFFKESDGESNDAEGGVVKISEETIPQPNEAKQTMSTNSVKKKSPFYKYFLGIFGKKDKVVREPDGKKQKRSLFNRLFGKSPTTQLISTHRMSSKHFDSVEIMQQKRVKLFQDIKTKPETLEPHPNLKNSSLSQNKQTISESLIPKMWDGRGAEDSKGPFKCS